jgi:hypothetical protein
MNTLFENLNKIEDRLMSVTDSGDTDAHTVMAIHKLMLDRLQKELSSYTSQENPAINFFSLVENKILNMQKSQDPMLGSLVSEGLSEFRKSEGLDLQGRKKMAMLMDSLRSKL